MQAGGDAFSSVHTACSPVDAEDESRMTGSEPKSGVIADGASQVEAVNLRHAQVRDNDRDVHPGRRRLHGRGRSRAALAESASRGRRPQRASIAVQDSAVGLVVIDDQRGLAVEGPDGVLQGAPPRAGRRQP